MNAVLGPTGIGLVVIVLLGVGLYLLVHVGYRPRPHVVLVHRRDDENAAPHVIPCASYGFASEVRSDLWKRLDPAKYEITIEPAGAVR